VDHHLVILKKPYLDLIVSGRKTIELRLGKGRQGAFGHVHPGDGLFLKVSSGPVLATATVADVKYYEELTPQRIVQIKRQYNSGIVGDAAVWESMMDRRYGFLTWLRDVRRIAPIWIDKKDWRAWVVLSKGKDFGLLSRIGLWETADACDA
jgi:ASC-1-like (ASCH) protein